MEYKRNSTFSLNSVAIANYINFYKFNYFRDVVSKNIPTFFPKKVFSKNTFLWYTLNAYADVAELADALDLGSSASGREGSSPFIRIYQII